LKGTERVIPGKTYTADDILDILKRRFWLIVMPLVLVLGGTVLLAWRTPNLYRSETVILVVPQQIPESYVRSSVTSRIEDRLQSIAQQILSRTFLERIILDFDLYDRDRQTIAMENIVETMRKRDILLETVKGDAFKLSYTSGDPNIAMKVTERLAALFIEANRHDREVLANGTNEFLELQLEDARRRLAEHEKKVEEYRLRYAGELPTQVESNRQVIQNTQLQIQALVDSLGRDRDRRIVLDRTLADLSATEKEGPPAAVGAPTENSIAQQLETARANLRSLEDRFTAAHPDVVRAKRQVRDLEARAAAAPPPASSPSSPPARVSAAEAARQARVSSLHQEIQNLDREIARKEAEERRLRDVIATYQTRVEAAPKRESELIELTRDYTTLQQVYTNLLTKREDSKVAANLERRQAGEQFKILDPARVPERPFSPNRPKIIGIGAVAGLALGLGIAALLEYLDQSLRTDDDVIATVGLPVLAMIPTMTTRAEARRRVRNRWLILSCSAAAAVFGVAAFVWKVVGR
jgi:polysaccharide chain length determinant protein (PEP-CTERM system associated)